jgi:hypothetical protein
MIGPELEGPRPPTGAGFSDAVTFAFGDRSAALFGLARVGLAPGDGGAATASALGLLFEGRDLAAAASDGAGTVSGAAWDALAVGPVRAETRTPLVDWRVAFDAEDGGFDLRFRALSPPASFDAETAVARAVGGEAYEQLCLVEGTVRTGAGEREVECLGQRGHAWGAPDWERIADARSLGAWVAADSALVMQSVRPAGERGHEHDAQTAVLIEGAGPDAVAVPVSEARLSTTYDADGRQRRAGVEFWAREEDDYPRRAAGEALCGTSLELGRLRLDTAFYAWHLDGRTGVGRYEIVRHA